MVENLSLEAYAREVIGSRSGKDDCEKDRETGYQDTVEHHPTEISLSPSLNEVFQDKSAGKTPRITYGVNP